MNEKLLLSIGGATGSGKTALAIRLAKKYPQLVILSADSRQIYRHLDIGSAKVGAAGTSDILTGRPEPVWYSEGVPQFLIDIAEPNTNYSLADYQQEAYRLILSAWQRGYVPFLVGGTGLYIQAVVEGFVIGGEPDLVLRSELEHLSVDALQQRLEEVGGAVVETDRLNKRRLIRAIERASGNVPEMKNKPLTTNQHTFVLERSWEEQRDLAPDMVQERLDLGLIDEVRHLLVQGVNKDWLQTMGLSYRLVLRMLEGEFTEMALKENMIHEFRQLMRRQRTWFRRMKQAHLMTAQEIEKEVTQILMTH
ncbi:MAG TPA: tRNA (adenosine(37)-N6)-dimethylallyltransferase MiaA [Patescibacteria group bacterium]